MEALACGCPVIGYASKSVDDQILPEGGEIVQQDNIDVLTEAIRRWIANPAEMRQRRRGARQRAETMFDGRKIADQLWQEYLALVKSSVRSSVQIAL